MSKQQCIYCCKGDFGISSVVCSQYNDWFCTVISTSQAYIMREGCWWRKINNMWQVQIIWCMRHTAKCLCVCKCKKYLHRTFALIYQCPHKSLQPTTELQTDYIRHRDVQQAIYSMLSVTNILRVFLCLCVCMCVKDNQCPYYQQHPKV